MLLTLNRLVNLYEQNNQFTLKHLKKNNTLSKIIKAKDFFALSCQKIIIDAYRLLKTQGYSVTWDEETFSANMKHKLENICTKRGLPYHITRENVQDNPEILKGIVKAKTARKIDIVFASFLIAKRLVYGIEAKILVENDFYSKRFSHLNSEYIDEGMDRYIKNIYKIKGCMVGYVIQGNPDKIIPKINSLLVKRKRIKEIIVGKFTFNGLNYCYSSKHNGLILSHFLLPFPQKKNN